MSNPNPDFFNGWPEDGEPVTTLSDEEMVAWANANIDRVRELEKGAEAREASLLQTIKGWQKAYAELEAENERQATLIRELNEHYGGQADEIERLTAVYEAAKTIHYKQVAASASEFVDLQEALAAVEEKDDE